jgi:hypothetical protein
MPKNSILAFAATGLAAFSTACATAPAAPPQAGAVPTLVLEDYFLGRTEAWGVVQNRSGTLQRQFKVEIDGTWDGSVLVLDERFVYADGARDRRVWTIRKTAPGRYEGTAGDVIGVAQGVVQGNQLSWVYDINLQINDRPMRVTFDDRMWLQSDGVLINRAKIRKFGITWGEVLIAFNRPHPDQSAEIGDLAAAPWASVEPRPGTAQTLAAMVEAEVAAGRRIRASDRVRGQVSEMAEP